MSVREYILIGNRYRLKKKIGAGSFGEIFAAEDIHTHELYAIKTEQIRAKCPQLLYEAQLYNTFQGSVIAPHIYMSGTEGQKNFMVIDLLGKSLEDLFVMCHRKFSVKTVLMLADQMISCVQFLHEKNYLHRDIKPDNFAIGRGKDSNKVFILDFGLSKRYRDQNTLEHIPYAENKNLSGTARYASINALRGIQQSRRDDLEALGYVWLYLLRGSLPWMGLQANGHLQKYRRILESKLQTPVEILCKGFPLEFIQYFYYVRKLQFTETPDYTFLRTMMRKCFERLNYVYDYQYDWIGMKTEVTFTPKKEILVTRPNKKGNKHNAFTTRQDQRNFDVIIPKDDIIRRFHYKQIRGQQSNPELLLHTQDSQNVKQIQQAHLNRDSKLKQLQQQQQLGSDAQHYDRLITTRKRRHSEQPTRCTPQLLTPSVREQMQMKKVGERPTTTVTTERRGRVTVKAVNEFPYQNKVRRF